MHTYIYIHIDKIYTHWTTSLNKRKAVLGMISLFFNYYLHEHNSKKKINVNFTLQWVNNCSVPQLLHILLGLVESGLLLDVGRHPLNKLYEVVAVHFIHDAEHATSMITNALQVFSFARERLSCRSQTEENRIKLLEWLVYFEIQQPCSQIYYSKYITKVRSIHNR